MTLVEVLIVVALFGLAASATTLAFGALTRTQLRSACMKVSAAVHFAYNRAIADGNTLRVVLDANSQTLSIEEAHGKVVLASTDDPRLDEESVTEVAVDPWSAARARLEETFEPSFGRSPFQPLTGSNGEALDRYRNVSLGDNIRIMRMYLPHEPAPRDSGRGAIHFFPTGLTEHAVIHLSDGGEERIYSVEVHPLTGRSKVHNFAYEPEEPGEEGFHELEDPQ